MRKSVVSKVYKKKTCSKNFESHLWLIGYTPARSFVVQESIFSSCCFVHAANGCQFFNNMEIQISTTNNTESCDLLMRSTDSSTTRKCQKKLLAFWPICATMFSPSSVLRTTELAKRLILANKSAFFEHNSCTASIIHSLM